MINGYDILKKMYPDFDEESRTPNGLDLRLGKVYEISNEAPSYGIYDDEKFIPEHIELPVEDLPRLGKKGWKLLPFRPYILEINRQVEIFDDSMQLYNPRSTLLRCGTAIMTAVGDAGYNGKLAFLFVNFSTRPFILEKGVRFSQLVDFDVKGSSISYDGDFQEEKYES